MGSGQQMTAEEEARALYREARSHWAKRTALSVQMAIRCLERAIRLDGSFAEASAALADCYSILMDYGVLSPEQGLTIARLASGRALYRGPGKAESLTAAGIVRQMAMDWAGAEAEFTAAIGADPAYVTAHQRYALFLAYMGRAPESRREIQTALELAPESPAVSATAVWIEYYDGNHQDAVELGRSVVRQHPTFASAEVALALSLMAGGQPDEGGVVLERALARESENVSLLSLLTYARGREGRDSEAERCLAELHSWMGERYVSPYYLAVPLVGVGKHEEAISALETAMDERSPQLVYLFRESIFGPIRANSRVKGILSDLGLPYRPEQGRSNPESTDLIMESN